ncbi:MAG: serpin family protein [Coriobacteriia bacterium]|nr:serpin family protein [Coriobacteriia bacterium]
MGTYVNKHAAHAMALALMLALCGIAFSAWQAAPANAEPAASAAAVKQAPAQVSNPAKPSAKQLKAFKKASADFSLELFQRCVKAKGKNANVTIAPMSVMNALSLTANGAKGATAKQMRTVLADGATLARLNKNLAWYNSKLSNSKKARIKTANGIWYHNDGTLKMKAKFLATSKKYYGAEIAPSDFKSAAAVNDVNSWVSDKTNGMIPSIVNRLDPLDRIILANALYFDAEWADPFDEYSVHTKNFKAANGKKHKVKMMYGTEHRYIKGKNVTGFMKPYAKGYSYVALLPKKGMSLKKYVASLDGDTFRSLVNGAKSATVHIAMPKYTIEYSNDSMETQLAAMGMKLPFTAKANFGAMAKSTEGPLSIGGVVHKTKIEVDERGTKAAAATAVVMKAGAAFMEDVKEVTLNRPFVYAIVDNTTKLPVFIGTVNDIKK